MTWKVFALGLLTLGVLALAAGGNPQVPVVQPATVIVPAYSSAYRESAAASDELLREILAELKGLRGDVQKLSGVPQGAQALQAGGLKALQKNCAACHEQKVADESGGKFVLLVGDQLAPIDNRQKERVSQRVSRGGMPPKESPQPKAEEKKAILSLFK